LKKGFAPPNIPLPLLYRVCERLGTLEKELVALCNIVHPGGVAIDVGANVGLWTYALARHFDRVEAFEPQPGCCDYLRRSNLAKVTVYPVALSSTRCEKTLKIPAHHGLSVRGMATFGSVEGPCDCIGVPVNTLDDYDFHEVSFIKIDVEGHESQVLEGARRTIARERPVMVIEIEQRHLDVPIEGVIRRVEDMGYRASFLDGTRLHPIDEYDYENSQQAFLRNKPNKFSPLPKKYKNNFVFKPLDTEANVSTQAFCRSVFRKLSRSVPRCSR
jgi:FkbM family methyltransferase